MITPKLTLVFDRKKQASNRKRVAVELRITYGKERTYISTGIRLLPREWSKGTIVNRPDWKELNEQLSTLCRKCTDVITQMMNDGCLEIKAVSARIKDNITPDITFIAYIEMKSKERFGHISPGTKRNYDVFIHFMKEWGGIISFADISERSINRMDEELKRRGLKECSRWNYHKLMKMFITKAINDGKVKYNPYVRLDIKRGNENGLLRYLTPAEFHRLEECDLGSDCLRKVRDLFVFQTYTLMGYADMAAFDIRRCENINGQVVYKCRRTKTNQEFVVPLIWKAKEILRRYNNKLPIISNVKYNLYLKAVAKYANIEKPISSHWARHTGATLMLNEGNIPMHIVQHILGHASIRETEKTYAKVIDSSIVDYVSAYQEKINGKDITRSKIVEMKVTRGKVR